MNVWLVAALSAVAACVVIAGVLWTRRKARLAAQESDSQADQLEEKLRSTRNALAQSRRKASALQRELNEIYEDYDLLNEQKGDLRSELDDVNERLDRANRRRLAAERDLSAAQMKNSILEDQLEQLRREQRAQEELYQNIIRDKEEELARFRDQQKHRSRRRNDAPPEQISISDLLALK